MSNKGYEGYYKAYQKQLKSITFRISHSEYALYEEAMEKGHFPSMRAFIRSAILDRVASILGDERVSSFRKNERGMSSETDD